MTKQAINFKNISIGDQKKIDRLYKSEPESVLSFLEDLNKSKLLNSISKAALISKNGNSRLKLIHEHYFFIIKNYVEKILLSAFDKKIKKNIYMFSFGRLFSKHNDIGVQTCTDFDFNLILDDSIASEQKCIIKSLEKMKAVLWNKFKIEVEINDSFSVLTFSELKRRIGKKDNQAFKHLLFYKSVEDNHYIFNDNVKIREYIASRTSRVSDLFIFEQYLGFFSSNKNSYFRIKRGDSLEIIPDNEDEARAVHSVIGSDLFRRRLKTGSLLTLNAIPREWYFSMKYMVNRVYDYVCAMKARGYSLAEIGLEEHDYNYIREANLIMLILQELKFERLDTERFGVEHSHYDFSYISGSRIQFFSSITPARFGNTIKSIMYDLKVIPRYEDLTRIEGYIKKNKLGHALWFLFGVVEFWISKKIAKLLGGDVLKDMKKFKKYDEYMNTLNLPQPVAKRLCR